MARLLPPSIADMRAELLRETAARATVYPRQHAAGRLTHETIEWRAAILIELNRVLTYVEQHGGWPPQGA